MFMCLPIDISYNDDSTPSFKGTSLSSILLTSFNIDFDEVANINSTKKLYIYNKSQNTIDITIPGTQLIQNAEKKTATYETGFTKYNVSSLEFDTSYAVLMDEELFENIYYNTVSGDIETYVDISAYNLLEFQTETRHEPSLVSITPDSSDSLLEVSGYILLEFDEPVTIPTSSEVPGGNNIAFVDGDGNSINYSYYDSSGNYLYIYYSDISYDTVYSVSFDEYSIVDASNIQFTIADSSLNNYSIQTIVDPRPHLQYYYPNSEVSTVYVDQPINLVFKENIYLDTSSNGRIQIESSNGSIFNYFDISNSDDVSGVIYGNGTNTLRIYPFNADASFSNNTTYLLSIDDNIIKDICDNYYPGITTSDSNAISFTTSNIDGYTQNSLINDTSGVYDVDDSGNIYIVFNGDSTYEGKQYALSVGTYILNISDPYPFTLLNNDLSNSIVVGISNDAIEIDISGGVTRADSTTNDYFVFTDANGNTISLANGDLKFMRGQTYKIKESSNIADDFEFVLYYNGTDVTLSNASDPSFVSFTPQI